MFNRKRQTACERIREMFSPYIDEQLSVVEREVVDFHANVCDACRYQLASMKKTATLLKSMPIVPVPRSFTLAEAPARGIGLPFVMPSMNWLRVATAAAIIALVGLVTIDLTGAVDESGEPVVASPTPTASSDVQPTPPDVNPQPTQEIENIDAPPPDPSGDLTSGIAGINSNDDIQISEAIDSVPWEAQQEADLENGEGEGLSPTPPPHSPSWLIPLEIVSGILVVILAAVYLLVWQRKRELSTTDKG